jgi:CRISPR-associated protein Cmr5
MKTMEQEFAGKVYKQVKEREGKPDAKKYGSMAHKLPILIRTAGLAEALAFVESRGKDPLDALLDDLAGVVSGQSRQDFVAQSRSADLQTYVYLTRRSLLALKWFKRFAQSVLGVDATEEGDNT